MRENRQVIQHMMFFVLLFVVCGVSVFPRGFREQVVDGNRALAAGDLEAAREAYEKAGISHPESPYLAFNNALLSYRADDLAAAKEGFLEAALRTKDLGIEALAHYNLGNVSVREAERQIDSDLEEAISLYEAAVNSYQRALELDSSIEDAAINTEVVRIILKDLLDKLAQQSEEQGGNEELEEIVERLQELIEREAGLIAQSENYIETADAESGTGDASASDEDNDDLPSSEELSEDQRTVQVDTDMLSDDLMALEQSMAQQAMAQGTAGQTQQNQMQSVPNADSENPLGIARGYVDASVVEQAIAASHLKGSRVEAALPNQQEAAELLLKALDELTDDEQQNGEQSQEQQSASEGEEQEEEQTDEANEAAEDILQEEEENREQRAITEAGRSGAVDRDW